MMKTKSPAILAQVFDQRKQRTKESVFQRRFEVVDAIADGPLPVIVGAHHPVAFLLEWAAAVQALE